MTARTPTSGPIPDGTLVVCLLDDLHDATNRPRLLVWRTNGPLEEVELPPAARELVAVLVTPDLELPDGIEPAAATELVTAALTAPLPMRSADERRKALKYEKSHEHRIRRSLATVLGRHRLSSHLVAEGNGALGLASATSDAAALFAAVDDGRLDDAVMLLRGSSRERADLLRFEPPRGWPAPLRAAVDHALGIALAYLREHDEPEVVDAEPVLDESTSARRAQMDGDDTGERLAAQPASGDDVGTENAPVTSAPVADVTGADVTAAWDTPAGALPLLRVPRRVRRAPRWRHRILALLAPVLALTGCAAWLAFHSTDGDTPPIPSSAAGPWPGADITAAIANLTKGLPFRDTFVPARVGDVLLHRQRLRTNLGRTRLPGATTSVTWSAHRWDADTVNLNTNVTLAVGGGDGGSGTVTGLAIGQRLRFLPGTTRLLDVDGKLIRALPDAAPDVPVTLPGLANGRVYFAETRVLVERAPKDVGEIGYTGLSCGPVGGPTDANAEVRPGAVVTCSLSLQNWGPRRLRTLTAQFTPKTAAASTSDPTRGWRQYFLDATLSSPDARPTRMPTAGGSVSINRWAQWSVEYVPGSAVVGAPSETRPVPGDPFGHGLIVTDVPATTDFLRATTLQFELQTELMRVRRR